MKWINKKKFLVYMTLMILGDIVSCFIAIGNAEEGYTLKRLLVILKILPVQTAASITPAVVLIWALISFFLCLGCVWQIEYKSGQALNRTALIAIFVQMTLLSTLYGVFSCMADDNFYVLAAFLPLLLVVGLIIISVGITYIVQKVQGHTGYEWFSDILTEEEYEKIKTKKSMKKREKRK